MQLATWLRLNKIPVQAFAASIGVTRQAAHRYASGRRIPANSVITRIAAATNGQVLANDFHHRSEAA